MRSRTRSASAQPSTSASRPPAIGYSPAPEDRRAITEACAALGLELAGFVREPAGDRSRPAFDEVLEHLASDGATCLVVRHLADLSEGDGGLAPVLERVEAAGLRLIALDVGLDTANETGRLALTPQPLPDLPWITDAPAPDAVRVAQSAELEADRPAAATGPAQPTPGREPAVSARGPTRRREAALQVIGYASASGRKDVAADDLAAQRALIEQRCSREGFELVELVGDREPRGGKALDRPGLAHALQRLAVGDGACLMVAGLGRISHSVAELGRVVRWLERAEIRLIVLDLDLDTANESGRAAARALSSVAEWERDRLAERTRAGLAAARAKRHAPAGAGAVEAAALRQRIAAMRAKGMTLQAIADALNEEGVPTLRGGAKWRPSSVQSATGYKRPSRARKGGRLPGPPDRDEQ
jgi:DNA invertase Pin-like site-specific DNA recombinase